MQKIIKRFSIILIIMIFTYNQSFSQINTSSPYSRFGIGDIENQALGRSLALGGTSVGIRLPYEINIINPASYSALPVQTFIFQVGVLPAVLHPDNLPVLLKLLHKV